MDERSQAYLDQYLNSLPAELAAQHTSFSSDYYCNDEYWYRHEGEPMPQVGHLQVVTDWHGNPVCIVEISSVNTAKYCDVSAEFAAEEGEGDKSLQWWREAHWDFFSKEYAELGIEPTQEMMLVLERFKVVYK